MFIAAINYGYQKYHHAAQFLCQHLGFSFIGEDDKSVTLNNGALSIRLHDSDLEELPLHLDVEASEYRETIDEFKKIGFQPTTDHSHPTQFRLEQSFKGPHGMTVTIYQTLTEDDLNIPTELKQTLDWQEDAVSLAQILLKYVSISFRELARKKMVLQAESFALIEGTMEVTKDFMITAFLYTTPYFKQDDLQNLLMKHGVSREFIDQKLQEN